MWRQEYWSLSLDIWFMVFEICEETYIQTDIQTCTPQFWLWYRYHYCGWLTEVEQCFQHKLGYIAPFQPLLLLPLFVSLLWRLSSISYVLCLCNAGTQWLNTWTPGYPQTWKGDLHSESLHPFTTPWLAILAVADLLLNRPSFPKLLQLRWDLTNANRWHLRVEWFRNAQRWSAQSEFHGHYNSCWNQHHWMNQVHIPM